MRKPTLLARLAILRLVVTLATVRTTAEYAHELYSSLRKADECGVDLILAAVPPHDGVGVAVMDRLRRAASDR